MPKILVADDNANIQKMVALSFEDRGIQVIAVGNGEAAVRRIPDLQPDLVLADIFMPVRNGYEVCEFVKKDERFSHIPVILLVGAFDPLDEKEARRVGADGVLKKPFVPPDPLIAMVMSALEKNPKIAAELAKAKEAKEAPAPEPIAAPIPEPANSFRAEVKPLPEFPEPESPEEAAIAYGFGTSRRTLEEHTESADEPKAPAAEADKAAEDEFDGSATPRDWRRNAMDFDIPADAANKPAFVSDENLEPAMFPSERDVPPRHVRAAEPEPPQEANTLAEQESSPSIEAEAPAQPSQDSADSEFFAATQTPEVAEVVHESRPEPVVEPEPTAQPESQSAPAHWMDQLAQGSSNHQATDWMSALSEQSAQSPAMAGREVEHAEPVVAAEEPAPAMGIESQPHPSAAMETFADSAVTESELRREEPFFADEPVASAPSESWLSPSPRAGIEETVQESLETTAGEAVPLAGPGSDEGFELESVTEPPLSYKDPDLVEPPAVHVTQEPLLVDEEPQAPSQYGAREQEVQPLYSFVVPSSPEPTVEEPPAPEASNSIETATALFAPEPAITSERIPTGPPPNREALAEIPFLTPPSEFRGQMQEPAATDAGTVDAVVQKVLQKLEPQLHDLLSQGVLKPLVENLLQSELAKKGK